MSEMTEATRKAVARFYDSCAAGERKATGDFFADRVDFEICAPPHLFEFAGTRRGIEGAAEAFAALAEKYEIFEFERRLAIVEEECACVYSEVTLRSRDGGTPAKVEVCDLMRFKDGRVIWFREFFDTVSAASRLFGGPPHIA